MTKTQHKRTAEASMFQNGISQNTKCAKRDGFHRVGHIYIKIQYNVNPCTEKSLMKHQIFSVYELLNQL